MSKYKITIEEIVEQEGDKYASNITLYEQTVTGDETIVNGVVKTVLDYNSNISAHTKVNLRDSFHEPT